MFVLAASLYGCSAAAYLADLYGHSARRLGWVAGAAGVAAETVGLALALRSGHLLPYGAAFAVHVFTFLIVANFLIADGFLGLRAAGAMIMPVATGAELFAALRTPAAATHLLAGFWAPAHLVAATAGYGALALAFAASGLYLVQARALRRHAFEGPYRRVPSLDWCDRAAHGLTTYGLPSLTVALAIELVRGSAAAAGTAVVWVVYSGYLWARATGRLRGRRAARLSAWGFAGVLANLLLIPLLLNFV